jgi:hypothetical protein
VAAPTPSVVAPVWHIAATRRIIALEMHAGEPLCLHEQDLATGVVLVVFSFIVDLQPADELPDGQCFQVH